MKCSIQRWATCLDDFRRCVLCTAIYRLLDRRKVPIAKKLSCLMLNVFINRIVYAPLLFPIQ
jgi:hypothetical protein